MAVEVSGMKELKRALTKKKIAIEKIASAVKTAGDEAEAVGREKAPKDTGKLASSFTRKYVSGGKTVFIEPTAVNSKGKEYAIHVEFGTKSHGKAQPFLRPSQEGGKKTLISECKKLVETK